MKLKVRLRLPLRRSVNPGRPGPATIAARSLMPLRSAVNSLKQVARPQPRTHPRTRMQVVNSTYFGFVHSASIPGYAAPRNLTKLASLYHARGRDADELKIERRLHQLPPPPPNEP